jgi:Concanavalin A-like lectin/glucanases superfamily
MAITIRSAQTIRNGVRLSGNVPIPNHITDGLLLYLDSRVAASWPGSGTTWYDLSGNGKHATFYTNPGALDNSGTVIDGTVIDGSTLLTDGQGDIRFNAATWQYAAGPNLGNGITQWTINTWFYAVNWPSSGLLPQIFGGEYLGGAPGINTVNMTLTPYNGSANSDNNIRVGFYDGNGPNWQLGSGYSISIGTWYNITGTYDGNTLKLYINGTLQESNTGIVTTTETSTLGYRVARRWDNHDTFDAYIPVVMCYNRALTSDEVAYNFNNYRSRYGV